MMVFVGYYSTVSNKNIIFFGRPTANDYYDRLAIHTLSTVCIGSWKQISHHSKVPIFCWQPAHILIPRVIFPVKSF